MAGGGAPLIGLGIGMGAHGVGKGRAACIMAKEMSVVGITISAYDPAFDAKAEAPPLVGQLLNDLLATMEGK